MCVSAQFNPLIFQLFVFIRFVFSEKRPFKILIAFHKMWTYSVEVDGLDELTSALWSLNRPHYREDLLREWRIAQGSSLYRPLFSVLEYPLKYIFLGYYTFLLIVFNSKKETSWWIYHLQQYKNYAILVFHHFFTFCGQIQIARFLNYYMIFHEIFLCTICY